MPRALVAAATAAAIGLALILLTPNPGFADGSVRWVKFLFTPQAGQNTACLTCGWHSGPCGATEGPALDFGGNCSDGNESVYFRNFGFVLPGSPNTYVGRAAAYDYPYEICQRVEVRIWDTETNLLGKMQYMHTYRVDSRVTWLYASEYGYENEYAAAQMANPDNQECIDLDWWTGPHVHELHEDGTSTFFLRDGGDCAGRYPCGSQSYPYPEYDPQDWWNDSTRGFCIDDTDCDRWTDDDEEHIGTDPADDCPDGTWDDAWPPDINNDTKVNLVDALLFKGELRGTNWRFDLYVDWRINIQDVLMLKPYMGTSCV